MNRIHFQSALILALMFASSIGCEKKGGSTSSTGGTAGSPRIAPAGNSKGEVKPPKSTTRITKTKKPPKGTAEYYQGLCFGLWTALAGNGEPLKGEMSSGVPGLPPHQFTTYAYDTETDELISRILKHVRLTDESNFLGLTRITIRDPLFKAREVIRNPVLNQSDEVDDSLKEALPFLPPVKLEPTRDESPSVELEIVTETKTHAIVIDMKEAGDIKAAEEE